MLEYSIDEKIDHRVFNCVLPGCGCSILCERKESVNHDYYKVRWDRVLVKVDDEPPFHIVFASDWLTKRELVDSSSKEGKRLTVSEVQRNREKAINKMGIRRYEAYEKRVKETGGELDEKFMFTETEKGLIELADRVKQRGPVAKGAYDLTARQKKRFEAMGVQVFYDDEKFEEQDMLEAAADLEDEENRVPMLTADSKVFLAELDKTSRERVLAYDKKIKEIVGKSNKRKRDNLEETLAKRAKITTSASVTLDRIAEHGQSGVMVVSNKPASPQLSSRSTSVPNLET
jgi:hypothetical protein